MKRYALFALLLLCFASATAQGEYDLAARNTEPARNYIMPYHTMAEALNGNPAQSRFVAQLEEFTRSEGGSAMNYTTHFAMPVAWLNRQVLLRVGYASMGYTVYVNGREVGYSPSGAMSVEFNITKASKEGRNELSIMLDKSLLANKIYESKEFVLEGVEVFSQPTIRIRDIITRVTLNNSGEGIAEVALPIKCDALNHKEMRLHYALRLDDGTVLTEGYREMALDMRREDTIRFASVVPAKLLWDAKGRAMVRLELESRIENRIVECIAKRIGMREAELHDGKLLINKSEVKPNLVEWEQVKSLDKVAKGGYNGIIITLDRNSAKVIEECAERGLYVVVRAPIDTTMLGDHIRRGGNPSNDPVWNESYLWRNIHTLHSTKGNCAVIGYAIARGKTSGINIYDTYLLMKHLAPNSLIIYEGAEGEWATDK